MNPLSPPYPPLEIANRVGSLEAAPDPWAYYDAIGRRGRDDILAALPEGFQLDGKRVLDFGCGGGRTLRHFLPDAGRAEFSGCDIDAPSIEWMRANLSPPLSVFPNGELPPLDRPDASFDLVYCISVFTHLTDSWTAWLLELHRVLAPGGLLVATFMGEGQSDVIAGEPWIEERIGMLVLKPGQSWDVGGPMVLHSPWWLREHWGRLFEVVSVQESGFCHEPGQGHGVIVLRKDERPAPGPAELESPAPDEPREAVALAHNVGHLSREGEGLRWAVADAERRAAEEGERRVVAERARDDVEASRSWQLTAPLRAAAALTRKRRDR